MKRYFAVALLGAIGNALACGPNPAQNPDFYRMDSNLQRIMMQSYSDCLARSANQSNLQNLQMMQSQSQYQPPAVYIQPAPVLDIHNSGSIVMPHQMPLLQPR